MKIKNFIMSCLVLMGIFVITGCGNTLSNTNDPGTGTGTGSGVNLGTAGNFVVLSKSGISTTGTTAIFGDIGSSPVAASYITGFGLIMDGTNTFSTSSLITGRVYAANYTSPTPTNMTTAISDMETAYTDAAGRTSPTATELGSGDISGMTITPGLYKWSTGLLMASNVTLSGSPTSIWIFQVDGDITMSSGVSIILTSGAKAENIYWQTAGTTMLNTTAHLEGIVLCKTAISLATGATINGRLLAQTAVSLGSSTVTQP